MRRKTERQEGIGKEKEENNEGKMGEGEWGRKKEEEKISSVIV